MSPQGLVMATRTKESRRRGAAASGSEILVVDDAEDILALVSLVLKEDGYTVTEARSGAEALERVAESVPDLIVSDVMMPDMDGFQLVAALRKDPATEHVPLIFLSGLGDKDSVIRGMGLGADDYVPKPFDSAELQARVRAKIARPPVPSTSLPHDRRTGLLGQAAMDGEIEHELRRAQRSERDGCLAVLRIYESKRLVDRLGQRGLDGVARQVADLLRDSADRLDLLSRSPSNEFTLLLPETDAVSARQRLHDLARAIAGRTFTAGGEQVQLTPMMGFAPFSSARSVRELRAHAGLAADHAVHDLNLFPVAFERRMKRKGRRRSAAGSRTIRSSRLGLQIAITLITGLVVPFIGYAALDRFGYDITPLAYLVVVLALGLTAALIWAEGFKALRRIDPPEASSPYPPATAVIVAYLPNEAATVMETVKAFLATEYPAPLQVILAYNTPQAMPVERSLRRLAKRDPRLVPFRVKGSESKAQNLNAALSEVTGEFVGIFDADHHPRPDAFTRAWRWLSNGYDVVQGHCAVRNGDASWVTRMVAVEFEAMYAVAHPGRERLHRFGIFGGSNGFWRTDLLRETRMHGFMLTEDIDSSFRVTEAGYRIASDPYLISRELAPGSLRALWYQRMRWSQGWAQASVEHLRRGLSSRNLTLRQKLGYLYLLAWREVYPWISLQVIPILAFWLWRGDTVDWFIPLFVATSVFTLSVGPGQAYFAYRLSVPEIRKHRSWFWFYLLSNTPFYTEFKNLIARVAQVKELMGEHDWRVTPRPATPPAPVPPKSASPPDRTPAAVS